MGLIRGVARTAVVAGTATAVSSRVSRRQYNRWAQQDEPPPGQTAAPVMTPAQSGDGRDRAAQLRDLADLRAQGVLTEQEFDAEKARILGA